MCSRHDRISAKEKEKEKELTRAREFETRRVKEERRREALRVCWILLIFLYYFKWNFWSWQNASFLRSTWAFLSHRSQLAQDDCGMNLVSQGLFGLVVNDDSDMCARDYDDPGSNPNSVKISFCAWYFPLSQFSVCVKESWPIFSIERDISCVEDFFHFQSRLKFSDFIDYFRRDFK